VTRENYNWRRSFLGRFVTVWTHQLLAFTLANEVRRSRNSKLALDMVNISTLIHTQVVTTSSVSYLYWFCSSMSECNYFLHLAKWWLVLFARYTSIWPNIKLHDLKTVISWYITSYSCYTVSEESATSICGAKVNLRIVFPRKLSSPPWEPQMSSVCINLRRYLRMVE
jgi:hypothetical protein